MGENLIGKTFVVTGATSGIGLAASELLARGGANVIGTGRSRERCQQAGERLQALNPAGKCTCCTAELSLQTQVRSLAEEIQGVLMKWKVSGLDGLLNNAGTVPIRQTDTAEGFDTQWAVNHMAPFLLTLCLLPELRKAPSARIVTVSSGSHYRGRINWEDIQLQKHYAPLRAYEQTKLFNVLFTAELDRRLNHQRMRAFAADPGLVRTDIGKKNDSFLARWIWTIHSSRGISAEESARGIVYLLSEASIQQAGEIYWKHGKPKPPNPLALDEEAARRLWELSMQMAGIKPGESPL
jgi:NAD(P)-dependent dehydrogenase (short-subunit alcohol dehydrogenase family)